MTRLDDDRFELAYINYTTTFRGGKLGEDEVVYHARKRVGGKLHWQEVRAPKSSVHTQRGKKFYLESLADKFKMMEKRYVQSEKST